MDNPTTRDFAPQFLGLCSVLLASLLPASTATAQGKVKPVTTRKPSIYADGPMGFSLSLPVYQDSSRLQDLFVFGWPTSKAVPGQLVPQMRGRQDELPSKLAELREHVRSRILAHENGHMVSEEKVTVAGRPALRWEHTCTHGGHVYRTLEITIPRPGQKVLSLQCMAPDKEFAAYRREFEQCLASYSESGTPVVSSNSGKSTSRPERQASSRYVDGLHGFSVKLPRPIESKGSSPKFTSFGPFEDLGEPRSKVWSYDLESQAGSKDQPVERDQLEQTIRRRLETMGVKVVTEKELTVGGNLAIQSEYTDAVHGNERRTVLLATILERRVIVVSCEARAEHFEAHRAEFERCLESYAPPAK